MFGSTILDVAIGLVFVYLMTSLVVTAGNELIAAILNLRAKTLEEGIRNLLNELNETAAAAGAGAQAGEPADGLRATLQQPKTTIKTTEESGGLNLAQTLYNHPLVKALYRKGQIPSYIPSRTFAQALLDIAVPVGKDRPKTIEGIRAAVADSTEINQQVRKSLLVLIDEAEAGLKEAGVDLTKIDTTLSKVHENIEVWFNNSMERVSGWYKRKTQAMSFILALIFAGALCVDSIAIGRALANDPAVRASLVSMAEKIQPPPSDNTPEVKAAFDNLNRAISGVQSLGIPVGWEDPRNQFTKSNWPVKSFGLLLSAIAASLGAPFWFDILNKIISIRSAGKSPEEKPKPPKEEPKPLGPGETPEEKRLNSDARLALAAGVAALTQWAASQGYIPREENHAGGQPEPALQDKPEEPNQ